VGGRIPSEPHRSIAGWVLTNNEPMLANDVHAEPRYFSGGGGERAELAVPIRAGARVLGVLDVQSSCTGAFHEMDISVLQILAGQIGVAIENARLHEGAQRSLRRTRAFQQVATAITASLDLQTTLEGALDAAMDVFEADRAALWLIRPGTRETYAAAVRNLSDEYVAAVHAYYASREWPDSLDGERSVYVEDAQTAHNIPEISMAARREGFRTMLYLPLTSGQDRLGTFLLYHNRVRSYSDDDIALGRTFADQANIAIKHARLFEAERRARDQASTILDATRTVTSSLQMDDVLAQAAGCIAAALHQPACGVWMLDDDGALMMPTMRSASRRSAELDRLFQSMPPIPVDAVPRIRALMQDNRPYLIQRNEDLTEPERAVQRLLPFDSYVAIPLAARERVIGVATVAVIEPGTRVDESDLEVAVAIARSTALALENARLYERSRQLAVSEERNRLARELHDSVTHSLFSITLIAQALPRLLDLEAARARERIERLGELGRGALAEMRALLFELRPAALEEQGLVEALTKHTAAFESREGIKVTFQVDGARRLPPRAEEALYRIGQEAMNNIAKHARATLVAVHLEIATTHATLTITDNGQGFDAAAQPAPGHRGLGMTSMRERAALLGGDCTVESTPGAGATVRVTMPVADGTP
jgi:signal transduction histidine kinase